MSHSHLSILRGKALRCGFSLVEVVMAFGLLSFALMGIVGLLPVGLSQFRESMDLTLQSQITQELVSEVQRTGYADLNGLSSTRHYDAEGVEVPDVDSAYSAVITVPDPSAVDKLISPTWTDPVGGRALSNVKAVTISISSKRSAETPYTTTTYVANDGTSSGS
jgi:uncharacterized protein (TIGR02598 family)